MARSDTPNKTLPPNKSRRQATEFISPSKEREEHRHLVGTLSRHRNCNQYGEETERNRDLFFLSSHQIYRKFPGFEYLVLDTMARADMYFQNDIK
ncbi:hypothetical protein JD844_020285 [Phrynosoma platyrhinos]|uniref:Uncharacterized protein n=1 Tax=Phrynosoma platyrhinos TaxID=52577 RepID=A0ABQ7SS90_PHRPL|nr:hypothetical protein JD844_020285 [Phrynosoma platyrhinos]